MKPAAIVPFKSNIKNPLYQTSKSSKYYYRIKEALKQAEDAIELELIDRLRKYSFIKRYSKPLKQDSKKLNNEKSMKVKNKKRKEKTQNLEQKRNKVKKMKRREIYKRIRLFSSRDDSDDNLSNILEEIDWEDTENLERTLLDSLFS